MQPSRLLKLWINEFLRKITLLKPQFVALHMQEVGGKTYEKSMEYVQEFIKTLCESSELENYNRIRIYLDEDFTSAEHFTVSILRDIYSLKFHFVSSFFLLTFLPFFLFLSSTVPHLLAFFIH